MPLGFKSDSTPGTPPKGRFRSRRSSDAASESGLQAASTSPRGDDDVLARVQALADGLDHSIPEDPLVVDTEFSPWQYEADGSIVGDAEPAADQSEGTGDMEADRKGLLRRLRDMTGMDLTRIPIPVYYNEPTSFLHRIAECVQCYNFLEQAASESDSLKRLLYITVFSITPYSSAERTTKPFNPILGETFEWTTEKVRFVAEQVSHHPPVAAASLQGKAYEFGQYKPLAGNFTGNAVVSPPMGKTWVSLPGHGEKYEWGGLTSCVHNILVGRLWVDHYGEYVVRNSKTGERAEVAFQQCGWFSRGWHEVKATVFDAKGKAVFVVEGHWNESLTYYRVRDGPGSAETIWQKDATPASGTWGTAFKGFSRNGQRLAELTELRQRTLPASDSRWRPDCRALANLNYRKAGRLKFKLEERQRAEKKIREARSDDWTPRWFSKDTEGDWVFTNTYWKKREERLDAEGAEDPVTPPVAELPGLPNGGK